MAAIADGQAGNLVGWSIKTESYAMYCFQVDLGIGLEIFSELGDKHIHASSQKIIVFAPDIQQHFFSFQYPVGMFAKEFQQVRFFLCKVENFLTDYQLKV